MNFIFNLNAFSWKAMQRSCFNESLLVSGFTALDHPLLWDRLGSLHWSFTADLRNLFLVPAPMDGYPPVHSEKANSITDDRSGSSKWMCRGRRKTEPYKNREEREWLSGNTPQ